MIQIISGKIGRAREQGKGQGKEERGPQASNAKDRKVIPDPIDDRKFQE